MECSGHGRTEGAQTRASGRYARPMALAFHEHFKSAGVHTDVEYRKADVRGCLAELDATELA